MSKDGGPAFPLPIGYVPAVNVEEWNRAQSGMSLRDYFAAAALQGMLAYCGDERSGSHHNNNTPDGVALMAFEYADAMIEARSK